MCILSLAKQTTKMFGLGWKLWFVSVTLVFWTLSEVSGLTSAITKPEKVRNEGAKSSTSDFPSQKPNEGYKRALKVNSSLKRPPSRTSTAIGYAAEWEYIGEGLEELEDPSETWNEDQSKVSKTPLSAIKSISGGKGHLFPSRRQGPGTWLDSNGNWWVFGGQGPSASITSDEMASSPTHYLSDLWLYGSLNDGRNSSEESPAWRLMYRPEYDGESASVSHPDPALFPLLCGNREKGHLSLFGGKSRVVGSPHGSLLSETETTNSLFTEDSAVWLYDIPKGLMETGPHRTHSKSGVGSQCNWSEKDGSCNGTGGLKWTSYICCDACLPDAKPTFEFCPQFSQEPILWCNHDSFMAFQVVQTELKTKKSDEEKGAPAAAPGSLLHPSSATTFYEKKVSSQGSRSRRAAVSTTTTTNGDNSSGEVHREVVTSVATEYNISGKNGSVRNRSKSHEDEGQLEKVVSEDGGVLVGSSPSSNGGGGGLLVEQQKEASEASVKKSGEDEESGEAERTGGARRDVVNWWKFDLTSTEWMKMPEVNMNAENAEQVASGNCRSVSDQNLLYILCPSTKLKLLERSILVFDPKKASVQPLGKIQLNNAFADKKAWLLGRSVFHAVRSDNHTVILLAYQKLLDLWIHEHETGRLVSVENVWKGSSLHAFQHMTSFYKLSILLPTTFSPSGTPTSSNITFSVYMVNPRAKLLTFEDPFPHGRFQITLVTDKAVFLPSRDAPDLSNERELQASDGISEGMKTRSASTLTTEEVRPGRESTGNGSTGSERRINKSNVPEGLETVTGLQEADGSIFNSSKTQLHTTSDPFREAGTTSTTTGDHHTTPSTPLPPHRIVASQSESPSSLLPNPLPSTHKNNTNNSEMKSQVMVVEEQVVGGPKKRILGIKRTHSSPDSLITQSILLDSLVQQTLTTPLPSRRKVLVKTTSPSTTPTQLPLNNGGWRKPILLSSGRAKSLAVGGSLSLMDRNSSTSQNGYSRENKSRGEAKVNLSEKVSGSPHKKEPLRTNFETGIDQATTWAGSNNSHQPGGAGRADEEAQGNKRMDKSESIAVVREYPEDDDRLNNLRSNYVSGGKERMIHYANESFMGDMNRELSPQLTYGSSEVTIDADQDEISEENYYMSYSTFGSLLFFSLSISIFATFGLIIFVKRCVKCPPRRDSVLLKEPPPIRYAVVPDELSFHTPIV